MKSLGRPDTSNPDEYAVVDTATGTVLSLEGLKLIWWNVEDARKRGLEDEDAASYADCHGKPLYDLLTEGTA